MLAEVVMLDPVVEGDSDRDSLHILPLYILPLETSALKRARLIKNARLKGVIELFTDEQTGSGQIEVENLAAKFGWPEDEPYPDLVMLRKLAQARSYDVYSLRLTLREFDIPVNITMNSSCRRRKPGNSATT